MHNTKISETVDHTHKTVGEDLEQLEVGHLNHHCDYRQSDSSVLNKA